MGEPRANRAGDASERGANPIEKVASVSIGDASAGVADDSIPLPPAGAKAQAPDEGKLGQPRLIAADAVNQPAAGRQPSAVSERLPTAPAPGPPGAMWLLVALVMGAAIGAVTGTVAALVIFG